jgi:hypothetical protein
VRFTHRSKFEFGTMLALLALLVAAQPFDYNYAETALYFSYTAYCGVNIDSNWE